MDWLTFDKVKALIALCTFLAGAVSYLGFDGYQLEERAAETQKQTTTIINHIYKGCKQ